MKCKMSVEEGEMELYQESGHGNLDTKLEIYHEEKSWVRMTSRAGAEDDSQVSGLDLGLDLVGLLRKAAELGRMSSGSSKDVEGSWTPGLGLPIPGIVPPHFHPSAPSILQPS